MDNEKELITKKKKKKLKEIVGFTLVELLAVIVILAIIMVIAIPNVLTTLNTARQRSFGQYVTKVYSKAQEQRIANKTIGIDKDRYDITTDLGLASTGDYKGYVLFTTNSNNEEEVYIGITDGEYYTATQYGETADTIVPYINYTLGGQPTFAASLTRYTGTNNFIKGDNIEITMPESSKSPEFVELTGNTTVESDFNTKLKIFYNKAYNSFKASIANNTATKREYTCSQGHDHGYDYKMIYEYKTVTGDTNENNNGYVIFTEGHYKDDYGNPINFSGAYIGFIDSNYHTATTVYFKPMNMSQTVPFDLYVRFSSDLSMTTRKLDTPFLYDQEQFGKDVEAAILGGGTYQEIENKINAIQNTYAPAIMYIPNSYPDGFSKAVYDLNTVRSAMGAEPDALLTQVLAGFGFIQK